jgi:hypothetical protein
MMKNKIKTNYLKSIIIISVGFVIAFLLTKWDGFLAIAVIMGLIGFFSNYLSKKIVFVWMKLAWLLSLIIPPFFLGIIFYLFLFPIAILSRLFGEKDPLRLKNKGTSFFVAVEKEFDKASFEKPW